jgi:hypothetical protein
MLLRKDEFLERYLDSVGLDRYLGLEVERIEAELLQLARCLRPGGDIQTWGSALHKGNQTWVGLALETLQTPYEELLRIGELLAPEAGQKVVDLGAGYGRLGVVLELFWPGVEFLGLEYVSERVLDGQKVLTKLGSLNSELIQQDLTSVEFQMPVADFYFIYDYGMISHIRNTLSQLDRMADQKAFKVIARGKGTRGLIEKEHPWLSGVWPPHHEKNFSIYQFTSSG